LIEEVFQGYCKVLQGDLMDHHRQQVLLVSTDPATVQCLSRALAQNGHAVTTARDWSEMMTKVDSAPLSVVLYDVMELNEKERKRLLPLRVAHPGLSMILLSSLESLGLRQAVTEGLIAAYLVKPLSLTALEECLDSLWIERHAALA
jgi:DNA-binding NtrC family response regulator